MPTDQPKPVQPTPSEVAEPTPARSKVPGPAFIRLPLGVPLSEPEALAMASDRSVRIVVLAGAVASGKTTLLTSLYELFQSGPISKVRFAECRTLPAFEQRCHLSRTESEKQLADTPRTPYAGPNPEYLHLRIETGREGDDFVDFLFTDVSGEMFEHARNSTDECKQFIFLNRAGHFLVFLDCEKALMPDKRWDIVQDVKTLLQSCLDSAMLTAACKCTVVWSKCDFFEAAKDKAEVAKFVAAVEADLRGTFVERIPSLKFHRTAARPTRQPNLKMGFGVRELLDDWIAASPQGRPMRLEPPTESGGPRESDQFAKRHYGGEGSE